VEIRLLGAVEVVDDQGGVQNVRGAYLRTLLVALALRCGEVVASDRLIDTLWGDAPPGDANGQGLGPNNWFVLDASGNPIGAPSAMKSTGTTQPASMNRW
jgi:hypothetical protein